MVKALVRFSLLLFLISAVGLVGLNRGFDPRGVSRIQAHDIVIELTSSSGNTLSFNITANCVSTAMAPSDTCIANVDIENTGEGDYTLSNPSIDVEGELTTCGDGGWFSAQIEDLSYTPNSHIVRVGDGESFNVVTDLALETPNDCQGDMATIVIELVATAIDDGEPDPTPTPAPNQEDDEGDDSVQPGPATPVPTATLVNEVDSVQATPATQATPVATFTSEVLPERFPNTGQGSFEDGSNLLELLFVGIGLLGAGVLVIALTVVRRKESEL